MRERHTPIAQIPCLPNAGPPALERHYTPKEVAALWGWHDTTVRRIFQDEPGVLKIGRPNRRDGKRCYVSIRIPESVLLRVHQELSR